MRVFPLLLVLGVASATALPSSAPAQSAKAKTFFDAGKKGYDDDEYPKAVENLEKAIAEYPNWPDALYYLGYSYSQVGKYDKSATTFAKLERADPKYTAYFYYLWARALEERKEWDESAKKYETFLAKYELTARRAGSRHRALWGLHYVTESPKLMKLPPTMPEPVNLGPGVNSDAAESAPTLDPTGRTLYLTSERKSRLNIDGGNDEKGWGENIYRIEKTSTGWSTPELLPEPINSKENDAAASFSGDGQTMVYVVCGAEGGVGSCDLYLATLEGTKWTNPRNLGNVVNSEEWDANPSITADGSAIFFVSQRPGGYGGSDIYVTRKNRFGDWGVPANLGPTINTPFGEYRPFLSQDDKTFYFSSNGHPGLGDDDIFVSVLENGQWTEPRNLGAPLNSDKDDNAFTIGGSGEIGYFTSERAGGLGKGDVYQIAIPEAMRPKPTVVVSGIVTNATNKSPIGAWVLVEDIQSGDLVATYKSNEASGKYLVVLPAGRDYSVSANRDGFFFHSERFTVPTEARFSEVKRDIALNPIARGSKVVLNNVFFETGSATLSGDSRVELRKVVDLLTANRTVVIEVGGHTDNVGNEANNMRLSHNRAMAVREFLISAGIAADRVQAKGYGQTNPVGTNDTPEGRQANRRTELIIISG